MQNESTQHGQSNAHSRVAQAVHIVGERVGKMCDGTLALVFIIVAGIASSASWLHAEGYRVTESDERIQIATPHLEAAILKRGYVSGIEGASLLDKKTGFSDAGFGLDIVDWIMEPGSDKQYRDKLADHMIYRVGNLYHGKRPKRMIEGPQICTQVKELSPKVIRGHDYVAIKQSYEYELAAPGRETGSRWTQTIVFPIGQRYFISSDRIDAVNASEAMFLRIDMPGHIIHERGNTFSEIYLSYETNDFLPSSIGLSEYSHVKVQREGQRIAASAFFNEFAPDDAFNYRRDTTDSRYEAVKPQRFIRAYRLRDPATGKEGPWLAGMTLDPSVVYEAWCHQRRGYVCLIQEFGGRAIEPGDSFSAAFIVGYFDSIDEMHAVYDKHQGHTGLTVSTKSWSLTR